MENLFPIGCFLKKGNKKYGNKVLQGGFACFHTVELCRTFTKKLRKLLFFGELQVLKRKILFPKKEIGMVGNKIYK